jgi:hypothetical protein
MVIQNGFTQDTFWARSTCWSQKIFPVEGPYCVAIMGPTSCHISSPDLKRRAVEPAVCVRPSHRVHPHNSILKSQQCVDCKRISSRSANMLSDQDSKYASQGWDCILHPRRQQPRRTPTLGTCSSPYQLFRTGCHGVPNPPSVCLLLVPGSYRLFSL